MILLEHFSTNYGTRPPRLNFRTNLAQFSADIMACQLGAQWVNNAATSKAKVVGQLAAKLLGPELQIQRKMPMRLVIAASRLGCEGRRMVVQS